MSPGRVLLVNPPPASPAAPPAGMLMAGGLLAGCGAEVRLHDASLELLLAELGPDSQGVMSSLSGPDFYESSSMLAALKRLQKAQQAMVRQGDELWQEGLRARLQRDHPQVVVLCLDSPRQKEAALCMARWLGQHAKGAQTVLWGPGLEAMACARGLCSDCVCLPGGHGEGLLSVLGHRPIECDPAQGLRQVLPQTRYLAPGPVLPLRTLGMEPFTPDALQEAAARTKVGCFLGSRGDLDLGREGAGNIVLGLDWDLAALPDEDEIRAAQRAGARMLRWRLDGAEAGLDPAAARRVMGETAKAGMWNHLHLARDMPPQQQEAWLRLALDNPHVVHSHDAAWGEAGVAEASGREIKGAFHPLPGRPLWQWLTEPAHLLLQAARHGVNALRCLRVEEGGSVYALTNDLTYHFLKPEQVTPKLRQEIFDLIMAGGRIKPDFVLSNLEQAFYVGYAIDRGGLVATASTKHPRPGFVKKMLEMTGRDFSQYLERGYISVRPEYRNTGVADHLIVELRKRWQGRNVFLVVAADHQTGREITRRNGSRCLLSYFNQEKQREFEIWTPEGQDDSLSLPGGKK